MMSGVMFCEGRIGIGRNGSLVKESASALLARILACALALIVTQAGVAEAKPLARGKAPAADALEAANEVARRKPQTADFVDAAQIYDYAPGAIYEVYAAPQFLSTILLEEGETLVTSAAGDTTRWMMESAQAAGPRGGGP